MCSDEMLARNPRLRPPRIAVGRIEMKSIVTQPPRVRSFEAMHSFTQDANRLDNVDEQAGGKLLIEEFYEYGGKAVCSNHVFNFKIGKSAFAIYLKSRRRE